MAGQSKVAWDSVEVWQKLVAAIIASGVKVDVSNVATHFGTTYDTIENRLRPIKKQAKALQEAVENGSQAKVTSSRKSPSKPRTPKKAGAALDTVTNARVSKQTPSKKTPKKEVFGNSFGSMFSEPFGEADPLMDSPVGMDFEGDMFP